MKNGGNSFIDYFKIPFFWLCFALFKIFQFLQFVFMKVEIAINWLVSFIIKVLNFKFRIFESIFMKLADLLSSKNDDGNVINYDE